VTRFARDTTAQLLEPNQQAQHRTVPPEHQRILDEYGTTRVRINHVSTLALTP